MRSPQQFGLYFGTDHGAVVRDERCAATPAAAMIARPSASAAATEKMRTSSAPEMVPTAKARTASPRRSTAGSCQPWPRSVSAPVIVSVSH
jgi:hypothetical protein